MRLFTALFFTWALLLSTPLLSAAAQLDVTTKGNGRFIISGSAMNGVSAIDLTITYDASILVNPVVSQGGLVTSAMMVVNANTPGTIRVALISTTPFSGSGQIAAVNFSTGAGGGNISSVKASLIDSKGVQIPARVTIAGSSIGAIDEPYTPDLPFSVPATTSQERQKKSPQSALTDTTTTATAVSPGIGTLTLSRDSGTPAQQETATQPPEPEPPQNDSTSPSPQTAVRNADEDPEPKAALKSTGIKQVRYDDIMGRFRRFKGERTIATLMELFSKPIEPLTRQVPLIAISADDSTLKIFTVIQAKDTVKAPTVATKGVRLISLEYGESAGALSIELEPRPGVIEASVSILQDNRLIEIPLVVIPPVDGKFSFTEAESTLFLEDNGRNKPQFDLNGDNRHDYIDDYIYAGHYLLKSNSELDRQKATTGKP